MNISQLIGYVFFFHYFNNDKSATSSKFINYFRSKKALSTDNSIPLSESDLVSLGWSNPKFEVSKLYTFLEKKTDGTYWLDERNIQAYNDRVKQTNIRFVAIILVIVLILISIVFI